MTTTDLLDTYIKAQRTLLKLAPTIYTPKLVAANIEAARRMDPHELYGFVLQAEALVERKRARQKEPTDA